MEKEDLKSIMEELSKINERLDKMDKHIDFIHGIYSYVKYPLGFLCNKINMFSGGDKKYTLEDSKEST